MKLVKSAGGKTTIKMSKKEWTDLGKKAGWMKEAAEGETPEQAAERIIQTSAFGIPIWEIIEQFRRVISDNDSENVRGYYPSWTDDDFRTAIKLLEPHE
jgi:hypothetical protein